MVRLFIFSSANAHALSGINIKNCLRAINTNNVTQMHQLGYEPYNMKIYSWLFFYQIIKEKINKTK